ncbi:MAG: DUF5908 family protein [Bacteroidota bacterium]|nr:DUF5908 family protein [Bacteroidota bacterium]
MPIEVKELIVRAWVDSQGTTNKSEAKKVSKSANETSEFNAQMLEQLKRMLTDKKDR